MSKTPPPNNSYSRITFAQAKENPEYLKTVGDYAFRQPAAKIIQRAFRNSTPKKDPLNTIYLKPSIGLNEPEDNGFNQHIKEFIAANNYDLINYKHPDFTRHLFGALRMNCITMNEMMSAKLMYESLIGFNSGQVPEDPAAQFSRFQLSDGNGPYRPEKAIDYWGRSERQQLAELLHTPPNNENLQYYTINLPRHQAVGFLYYKLVNGANNNNFFSELLSKYIQQLTLTPEELAEANRQLVSLSSHSLSSDQYFKTFIEKHEPNLKSFLNKRYSDDPTQQLGLDRATYNREIGSVQFLVALDAVNCQIPMLCNSPQYDPANPASPFLSFVLPTIDTLNSLTKIVHGVDATTPIPVVGNPDTRHLRAADENPALKLDPTQPNFLSTLYPMSADLTSSSRPTELTHPDIKKFFHPHGYDCNDFLLSWHDIFHAWRNGENYKGFIRKYRQLHDDKSGFAIDSDAMSKDIWALVDLDSPAGHRYRLAMQSAYSTDTKKAISIQALISMMKTGGYDFTKETDDNDLFVHSLCTSPNEWQSSFFGIAPTELQRLSAPSNMSTDTRQDLEKLMLTQQRIQESIKSHPQASVVELILRDLLKPQQPEDQILFEQFKALDLKTVFYWSKNTGVYFQKKYQKDLKAVGISTRLRENTAENIRIALSAIAISQKTPEKSIMPALIRQYYPSIKRSSSPTIPGVYKNINMQELVDSIESAEEYRHVIQWVVSVPYEVRDQVLPMLIAGISKYEIKSADDLISALGMLKQLFPYTNLEETPLAKEFLQALPDNYAKIITELEQGIRVIQAMDKTPSFRVDNITRTVLGLIKNELDFITFWQSLDKRIDFFIFKVLISNLNACQYLQQSDTDLFALLAIITEQQLFQYSNRSMPEFLKQRVHQIKSLDDLIIVCKFSGYYLDLQSEELKHACTEIILTPNALGKFLTSLLINTEQPLTYIVKALTFTVHDISLLLSDPAIPENNKVCFIKAARQQINHNFSTEHHFLTFLTNQELQLSPTLFKTILSVRLDAVVQDITTLEDLQKLLDLCSQHDCSRTLQVEVLNPLLSHPEHISTEKLLEYVKKYDPILYGQWLLENTDVLIQYVGVEEVVQQITSDDMLRRLLFYNHELTDENRQYLIDKSSGHRAGPAINIDNIEHLRWSLREFMDDDDIDLLLVDAFGRRIPEDPDWLTYQSFYKDLSDEAQTKLVELWQPEEINMLLEQIPDEPAYESFKLVLENKLAPTRSPG